MIANEVLYDKRLSLRSKGLYSYLFSKPDGWDFSSNRIQLESKDGVDSVLSGLKELEDAGYLERNRLASGKMEYHIKHGLKPNRENPCQGKDLKGKTPAISNKEGTSNIEKESKTEAALEESFSLFWKEYPNKVAKPMALKWWLKHKPTGELLSAIMNGLAAWKKTPQWTKDRGAFIPHPTTWLNQERWESTGVGATLTENRKTIRL